MYTASSIIQSAPTTIEPARKRTARGSRTQRFIATVATVAALAAGSIALAEPAQAATSTTSYATVCFQHTGGQNYTYNVYPMVYTNGAWNIIWSVPQRSVNGCTTWGLPSGYFWSFRAYTQVGSTYFIGTAPVLYIATGHNYNYGTSHVTQSGY